MAKRLYEHFSSEKTLFPSSMIQRFQLQEHFGNWIEQKPTTFVFDPQNISFGGSDIHEWNAGIRVSVGGSVRDGEIEEQTKINESARSRFDEVWQVWRNESHINFEEKVRGEILSFGKSVIKTVVDFEKRKIEAAYRLAQDPNYEIDLNDVLHPESGEILSALTRVARAKSIPEKEIPATIGKYFNDYTALLEVPYLKISSIMLGGLARFAGLGEYKQPPKSAADIEFISSYLPYCDAMFVDLQSRRLIKELPKNAPPLMKLDEYTTKVFSIRQSDDFLKYLDNLLENIPPEVQESIKDMEGDNHGEPY